MSVFPCSPRNNEGLGFSAKRGEGKREGSGRGGGRGRFSVESTFPSARQFSVEEEMMVAMIVSCVPDRQTGYRSLRRSLAVSLWVGELNTDSFCKVTKGGRGRQLDR